MKVFLVAGEHSGDQLGFKLMQAIRAKRPDVTFLGVGGEAMEREGLKSLFPLSDIAVMGILPVVPKIPTIHERIHATVSAIMIERPDVLVIIDSPDFTHRVAKRARQLRPDLPVVDYVSPSVWAWRPGRAKAMRAYVDHVLALLPFEPGEHYRLGGPKCTYIGHPLTERLDVLRPDAEEEAARGASPPTVLVLPGSRRTEISRLMPDFGAALGLIREAVGPVDFVLPAVSHLEAEIREKIESWPVRPRIVIGEEEKYAAFRRARAALAASGTVSLELALSGVPMVVAYKISRPEELLKYLVRVPSIVLPNLILSENAVPEILQEHCTPEALAKGMIPLIQGGKERQTQISRLEKLDRLMRLDEGQTPSALAAEIVLRVAEGGEEP